MMRTLEELLQNKTDYNQQLYTSDDVDKLIKQAYNLGITSTIERFEGIIGEDLPLYGFGNMQGRDPSDDAKAKNELKS